MKTSTICPYCGVGCGMYLTVENGVVTGVEPSSASKVNKGSLCVKGWNAFGFINHPDRLRTPLIRKNGTLTPSSFDEALSLICSKFKEIQDEHAFDALYFASSAKGTNEENYLFMKLARAVFRTNNIDHCARLCHSSTVVGLVETLGSGAMTNSIDCIDKTDLIFVIGSNTTEQHPIIGARILSAAQRGTKLIVADNRTIPLSYHADIHIRHKNGSDVALLNAMMQVIIAEGLADLSFINERTENYTALAESLTDWTPERASSICNIPALQIIEAARLFANAKNAMIFYAMGITQHTHGVDNVRCCSNLALLTGNVGRVGTGINPLRGQNNVQGSCDMGALPDLLTGYQKVDDPEKRDKFAVSWGVDELPEKKGLPLTGVADAIISGEIRGMYIMGENPLLADPDQTHVKASLEKLDFLVVQDIFLTETAQIADVVLPAACFAEKDGTFTNTERRVQLLRKAVEPPGDALADWEIICKLAKIAGFAGMDYLNSAEIMDEIASLTPIYGGITHDRVAASGLQWPCQNENHPGTPILHINSFNRGLGRFSPVSYKPSVEPPDEEFPYLLTTGRTGIHWHTGSMTRRTYILDREEPSPFIEINLHDAEKMGIRNREEIFVESRRGALLLRVKITDKIIPGVVFMPFHFAEGAANILTSASLDPESGIPEFKVCAVKLRKKP